MVDLGQGPRPAGDLAVAQLYHHHDEAGLVSLVLASKVSGTQTGDLARYQPAPYPKFASYLFTDSHLSSAMGDVLGPTDLESSNWRSTQVEPPALSAARGGENPPELHS